MSWLDPQTLTAAYLVFTALACAWTWRPRRASRVLTKAERHEGHIADSLAVLRRARRGEVDMASLRMLHPHLFEEVVLSALSRRGHAISRSDRYTGDGGADGEVRLRGLCRRRFLVQSKRYKGAIRSEHIDAFRQLCRAQRCRGLFVHTGTMGPKAREADARARRVVVVEDEALLRLVRGRRTRVGGVRL